MRYWFTTHWPPREDEPADGTPHGVWVPDGMLNAIQDLAPGDIIRNNPHYWDGLRG